LIASIAAACAPDTTESASGTILSTTTIAERTVATSAPSTTTTEPRASHEYGGQAVVGDDQEPPTLNVFVPGGDSSVAARIGQGYLAGVQEIDGNTLELIPELVTELPTVGNGGVSVNADGTMTVRYTIRDEAIWSDGVPISGADFQFTLDTILDPTLPVSRAVYESVVSSAYSDKTFEYTLARPTAQYELLFNTVLPEHAVDGSDFVSDWNDVMWPSAGPFVLTEWSKGEFLTLERNESYWKVDPITGQSLPYLDEVIFRFIPSTEGLINAFSGRELDVIQPPPDTETIQQLQALEPAGARVEVLSGPVWEHLSFQFGQGRLERNPSSCSENLNLRTAVAHAIDRTKLTDELLAGQVEPMSSYVEAFSPTLSNGNWAKYEADVGKAADAYLAAVTETGKECKVVFTTTSNNDARVKMSLMFASMFEAAGIPYENSLEDSQLFVGDTLSAGRFDLAEWAWIGSPGLSGLVSSFDLFDPEAPPPSGSNYYRWGTEGSDGANDASVRFAGLRDEANATVDEAELERLVAEGESILADNLVIIPLYARLVTAAVWADEIGGFKHNPTQASDTWNIEEWYRSDA
jgi:peptide/nickel transport system substrate-binding protein